MPFEWPQIPSRMCSWTLFSVFVLYHGVAAFQIEVRDVDGDRKYPWQLCRGNQGRGIGHQLFAIDREITTCEREGADIKWFATSVFQDLLVNTYSVTLGGPSGEEPSVASPQIYFEHPPGTMLTMEVKPWENSPAEFRVKRNGKYPAYTNFNNPEVQPNDYLAFYGGHILDNRTLRMLLGYRRGGSNLRLDYQISLDSGQSLSKTQPAVKFYASDGATWNDLKPLSDEQRYEFVDSLENGRPFIKHRTTEGVGNRNEPHKDNDKKNAGRIFGKIGKAISMTKGKIASLINKPQVTQVEGPEEEEKINIEESLDRRISNPDNIWYDSSILRPQGEDLDAQRQQHGASEEEVSDQEYLKEYEDNSGDEYRIPYHWDEEP
ncbi:hypothetical protein H072_8621 [Dactylellina haptotyla CBS 200.50]|uniref:Uncharacterized protein n=1 Tax=Dactylellina haptotyla (strain CBS 200.50) TaxID=1284197 RepID=S8BQY8_DACHA|nr:hypothetical protein H072_8621 [Dactylellina haptotyla CBS 200.50]